MTDFAVLRIFLTFSSALSAICFTICLAIKFSKIQMTICKSHIKLEAAFLIASLTFAWYSISIGFTMYNKWLMSEFRGGFPFPISYTTIHMFVKFLISRIWYRCQSEVTIEPFHSFTLVAVVILIGICTSGDVALSNESIIYLDITVYTTLKAAVIVFTFLWTVIVGIETFNCLVCLSVVLISGGVGLAILSTSNVSYLGVMLSATGSCLAGLRWTLLQYLLLCDWQCHRSSMVALYRFSPYSFLFIIPVAYALEGGAILTLIESTVDETILPEILSLICVGGLFSFVLIIFEVQLVQLTSSLTLSVIGQVKEVLQIGLGLLIYHDNVTIRAVTGIAISLLAAQFYQYLQFINASPPPHSPARSPKRRKLKQRLTPTSSLHGSDRHELVSNSGSRIGNFFRRQNYFAPRRLLDKLRLERFNLFPIIEEDEEDDDSEEDSVIDTMNGINDEENGGNLRESEGFEDSDSTDELTMFLPANLKRLSQQTQEKESSASALTEEII